MLANVFPNTVLRSQVFSRISLPANFATVLLFLSQSICLFFVSSRLPANVPHQLSHLYPGKEIAIKTQITWDQNFNQEIQFVTGDEWKAGNLSYHLKSRPKWEGFTNDDILNNSSEFICIDDVCLGRY